MATLHTVNKSPFDKNSLQICLSLAKDGSGILLIEDGVYAATKGTKFSAEVEDAMKNHKVYALESDLSMRGVINKVIDGVEVVDYAGFVDLTAEYSKVQSWL
ncbi:MAG: sulfurtransferase complex subunit TusB [Gammaproteobacteria bacterium]|nr:MAG: sulfurtransferase complex subunit TusB [Gammaproteobacteria bacterium]